MLEINGLIKNKEIDSTKFSKAIFKIENTDLEIYKNLTLSIYLNEGLYIKDKNIFINKKLLSFNKNLTFEIKEMKMKSSFILEFEIGIKKEFKEKNLDVRLQIMGFNFKGIMIVKDMIGYIKNGNVKEFYESENITNNFNEEVSYDIKPIIKAYYFDVDINNNEVSLEFLIKNKTYRNIVNLKIINIVYEGVKFIECNQIIKSNSIYIGDLKGGEGKIVNLKFNLDNINLKDINNITPKCLGFFEDSNYKKEFNINLDCINLNERLIEKTNYIKFKENAYLNCNDENNENKLKVFIQSNKEKVKIGESIIYKTVIINGSKKTLIFMYKLTSCSSINLLNKYIVDKNKACKDYVTFKLEPNCGVTIRNKGKYYNEKDTKLWVQGLLKYKFIKNNKINDEVFKLKTERVYLDKS